MQISDWNCRRRPGRDASPRRPRAWHLANFPNNRASADGLESRPYPRAVLQLRDFNERGGDPDDHDFKNRPGQHRRRIDRRCGRSGDCEGRRKRFAAFGIVLDHTGGRRELRRRRHLVGRRARGKSNRSRRRHRALENLQRRGASAGTPVCQRHHRDAHRHARTCGDEDRVRRVEKRTQGNLHRRLRRLEPRATHARRQYQRRAAPERRRTTPALHRIQKRLRGHLRNRSGQRCPQPDHQIPRHQHRRGAVARRTPHRRLHEQGRQPGALRLRRKRRRSAPDHAQQRFRILPDVVAERGRNHLCQRRSRKPAALPHWRGRRRTGPDRHRPRLLDRAELVAGWEKSGV